MQRLYRGRMRSKHLKISYKTEPITPRGELIVNQEIHD
jgi:hypothetical protein